MPSLAEHFTVIAVDQRGIGLSDKPEEGYDTGTLASDMIGLMDALGHDRFAVIGHDTGLRLATPLQQTIQTASTASFLQRYLDRR